MRKRKSRMRLTPGHLVVGAVGLALSWLILSTSGAAFMATRRPSLALALNGSESQALVETAQRQLEHALRRQRDDATASTAQPAGTAKTDAATSSATSTGQGTGTPGTTTTQSGQPSSSSGAARADAAAPRESAPALADDDIADISKAAMTALRTAPLDARALRILAQIADVTGDKERKRQLLQAIIQRTKHEPLAGYWLMLEAMDRKDYAGVVRYADIVLSKNPGLAQYVAPMLVRMIEGKEGDEELKERLRANPVWRSQFMLALSSAITDARTPLEVILSLKGSQAPATDYEVRHYLSFLFGRRLYEIAYYAWLQSLDADSLKRVGLVNNGGFEWKSSGVPFDWTIPSSPGATVAVRLGPGDDGKALHVEFDQGRVDFRPVHQYVVLQPGAYTFKLKQKGEITGRRGLQWWIACSETSKRLAETPMMLGTVSDWREVQVDFIVPAEGCRMQVVQLNLAARSASEQLVKGHGWFDDVQILKQQRPE